MLTPRGPGIFYSFFEVFPLVYPVFYNMNLGETGIVFLCVLVGCFLGMAVYAVYVHYHVIPSILRSGLGVQERRLIPALFATFLPPVGLFLFAWTARENIHWIVPTIGISIYAASVFVVFQCVLVYLPLSYPQYVASLFAGNDFSRSATAAGSILFSRPMYINLGVGKGVSILAGLSVAGILGMWALWWFGARLRARSRFATK